MFTGARVEGTVTDREGRPLDTTVLLEPLNASSSTTSGRRPGPPALQGLQAGDYAVHGLSATGAEGRRVEFMPQRVHLPQTGPATLALTEQVGAPRSKLHIGQTRRSSSRACTPRSSPARCPRRPRVTSRWG